MFNLVSRAVKPHLHPPIQGTLSILAPTLILHSMRPSQHWYLDRCPSLPRSDLNAGITNVHGNEKAARGNGLF